MLRRYCFYLENGHESIIDEAGVQATNLDLAIKWANEVVLEMQVSGELAGSAAWTLVIRDDDGTELKRIPL